MLKSIGAVSGPLITTFHGHDVTRYPLEQGKNVYDRLFEVGVRFLGLDPVMADRLKGLGHQNTKSWCIRLALSQMISPPRLARATK